MELILIEECLMMMKVIHERNLFFNNIILTGMTISLSNTIHRVYICMYVCRLLLLLL